jgi:hypothetical protein
MVFAKSYLPFLPQSLLTVNIDQITWCILIKNVDIKIQLTTTYGRPKTNSSFSKTDLITKKTYILKTQNGQWTMGYCYNLYELFFSMWYIVDYHIQMYLLKICLTFFDTCHKFEMQQVISPRGVITWSILHGRGIWKTCFKKLFQNY